MDLMFVDGATGGVATLFGCGNAVHYARGATGNATTCTGASNSTDSERDGGAGWEPTNVTTFNGTGVSR